MRMLFLSVILVACSGGSAPTATDAADLDAAALDATAALDTGESPRDGGSPDDAARADTGVPEWPHEPAGLTSIADWNDEAELSPRGWGEEFNPNPFNGASKTLVTSGYPPAPPLGGPAVIRTFHPEGSAGGYGGGQLTHDLGGVREVFVGVVHAFASTHAESGNSNKQWFVLFEGGGRAYIGFAPSFTGNFFIVSTSPEWGGGTQELVTTAPVVEGTWQTFEWYLQQNGPGTGVMRLWVDGELALERTDLTFPTGAMIQFYDDSTNNGNRLPTPSDPPVIGPGDGEQWVSRIHLSAP